jgi:predicted TIM-barrel fold metal-dependent hydrolase
MNMSSNRRNFLKGAALAAVTPAGAAWVKALREVARDRSPAEQRKLFHDNAERVYRLRP